MRFAVFNALVALWVFWRFLLPLHIAKRYKQIAFVFLLVISSFTLVTTVFFGGLLSPEVPAWVLMVGHGCEFALVVLGILTLLREAVIFLCVLAGRSARPKKRFIQRDRRVAIGMAVASAGLAATGVKKGIEVPDVLRYDVPVVGLPDGLNGMTIVQLSDLHASALLREPHMAAIVEKVNALDPDLIVVTGDIVDGLVENRKRDVMPLKELRARHGVIACEGNHEHYHEYDRWMERIPMLGMKLLRNDCCLIEHNGAVLTVGAVTDPWAKRFGRELPDVNKAFRNAPEKGPRILLAHQPKPARHYEKAERFDIMLSGHTHGGQVWGMMRGVSILNATFVRGWYRVGKSLLYVHSGSGLWNGFPIRLGVPSEIALLTLRKADRTYFDNPEKLPVAQ